MQRSAKTTTRAFTLVELLVVLAIVGVLVGLLMPAVGSVRESARRLHCINNLKQLATAVHVHHDSHRHYPTNGWGYRWVGDPSRGFGEMQPGGWIFNILPFVEQEHVRIIPYEQPGPPTSATARLLNTPIPLLNCPSRRVTGSYPYRYRAESLRNSTLPLNAAKSDYAINGGDHKMRPTAGPPSTNRQDLLRYQWPSTSSATGVSYVRSRIRMADIRDGASNTLLLGEKYIARGSYTSSFGDDQGMYVGDSDDIRRWTIGTPWPDTRGIDDVDRFGSRHSGGCHFAFCDGSVRRISYTVDPTAYRALGNRRDFVAVNLDDL